MALENKKVAILATHGFEESELASPQEKLIKAGVEVHIVSPQKDKIKAWSGKDWGKEYTVDKHVAESSAADYDLLVLPGGVLNPDKLRVDDNSLSFVKSFIEADKPIAAICHGAQTLIETDYLKGKKLTSVEAVKTDLINAGGDWVDEAVVVDQGLISSRVPDDLPDFNKAILDALST